MGLMPSNVVPFGRSTGPRTAAGKRRSSLNALKSGLYSSTTVIRHVESQDEYNSFARGIVADLDASSPLEMALAERLCSALWRGRRLRRYETARLSAAADRARIVEETSERYEGRAEELTRQATAVAALLFKPAVDSHQLKEAADGFSMLFEGVPETHEAIYRLTDRLDELAASSTMVKKKSVATALGLCARSMPIECCGRTATSFVSDTASMMRAAAAKIRATSVSTKSKSEEQSTDALMLSYGESKRLEDAERRIDRQVSSALADIERARGLSNSDRKAPGAQRVGFDGTFGVPSTEARE